MASNTVFLLYVLSFGLAAVLCFGSLLRVRLIEDTDTRRGLGSLLLLSGGWTAAQLGYLVAPTVTLKLTFYYGGLFCGISAVGAWLYFCSAYTGRRLHRSPPVRQFIAGVISTIILVKLTNPLHQFYFRTETVTSPFSHLAIEHGMIHWISMGIAYALATVGYFMLLELFWTVDKDTRPLLALIGITGLPVILDVLGEVSPQLLSMTYSPLGVGFFAIGVLFVYLEDFQTIQLAGEHDDPIILVDQENQIRDFNTKATELFPDLETGIPLQTVAPEIAERLESEGGVIETSQPGGGQYYQISTNPFTARKSDLGMAIILTDITEREQYRQELERQNERLDKFASIVSHDLRNPLTVATLQVENAQRTLDHDSESLDAAANALERMEALIERLLSIARQGESVEEPELVDLSTVATDAWDVIDIKAASLTVDSECTIRADKNRLQQLLENLFRNAIDHGGENVSITVGDLPTESGFYVADDGPGIPEDERDAVFEFGYTSNADRTGFGLAIVSEIVSAHNWEISITDSSDGGAQFEITGVEESESWG